MLLNLFFSQQNQSLILSIWHWFRLFDALMKQNSCPQRQKLTNITLTEFFISRTENNVVCFLTPDN